MLYEEFDDSFDVGEQWNAPAEEIRGINASDLWKELSEKVKPTPPEQPRDVITNSLVENLSSKHASVRAQAEEDLLKMGAGVLGRLFEEKKAFDDRARDLPYYLGTTLDRMIKKLVDEKPSIPWKLDGENEQSIYHLKAFIDSLEGYPLNLRDRLKRIDDIAEILKTDETHGSPLGKEARSRLEFEQKQLESTSPQAQKLLTAEARMSYAAMLSAHDEKRDINEIVDNLSKALSDAPSLILHYRFAEAAKNIKEDELKGPMARLFKKQIEDAVISAVEHGVDHMETNQLGITLKALAKQGMTFMDSPARKAIADALNKLTSDNKGSFSGHLLGHIEDLIDTLQLQNENWYRTYILRFGPIRFRK